MSCAHHGAYGADAPRTWWADDGFHVDLRGLSPPEPLVTVLQVIESGEGHDVITAHFDRDPIFLYPELDERGWGYDVLAGDGASCEHEVQLRLTRWRS